MRQFLLGLTISIAFIAGCVASQLAQIVIPPARAGAPTQRWEYFCERDTDGPWTPEGIAKLNSAGREGWEFVQQLAGSGGIRDVYCFKRPAL